MRHLCEKPLEAHEIWFARRIRGQACGRPSSCASRRRISRSPGTVPRAVAWRSCLAMRFAGEDLNEQGAALGNHLLQTAPRGSVAPLAPEFQNGLLVSRVEDWPVAVIRADMVRQFNGAIQDAHAGCGPPSPNRSAPSPPGLVHLGRSATGGMARVDADGGERRSAGDGLALPV